MVFKGTNNPNQPLVNIEKTKNSDSLKRIRGVDSAAEIDKEIDLAINEIIKEDPKGNKISTTDYQQNDNQQDDYQQLNDYELIEKLTIKDIEEIINEI